MIVLPRGENIVKSRYKVKYINPHGIKPFASQMADTSAGMPGNVLLTCTFAFSGPKLEKLL